MSQIVPVEVTATDIVVSSDVDRIAGIIDTWLGGLKDTTAKAYRKDLGLFANYVNNAEQLPTFTNSEHNATAAMALTFLSNGHPHAANALNEWRTNMLGTDTTDRADTQALSPSTINRRLSAVRSLVNHSHQAGLINWQVSTKGVQSTGYRDTRGPGLANVRLMVETLETADTPKAARDLALVRLMFDLGLRRGEVVALDMANVDLANCEVWVMGKGKRERESITLAETTCDALCEWIDHRGNHQGPLFTNFDHAGKGARLTGRSVARIIKAIGVNAKVKQDVSPHGLRHTAITAALDATNGNTRAAQKFSRHADPRTLNVYDDNREDLAGQIARQISELI